MRTKWINPLKEAERIIKIVEMDREDIDIGLSRLKFDDRETYSITEIAGGLCDLLMILQMQSAQICIALSKVEHFMDLLDDIGADREHLHK